MNLRLNAAIKVKKKDYLQNSEVSHIAAAWQCLSTNIFDPKKLWQSKKP